MAARPPANDEGEEPASVTFGIAAVDEHLDGANLEFPADASEIVAATGDPEIPYNVSGRSVSLSEALDDTGEESFDSRRELLDALHPVFEERRQSAGPSIVEWIRGILPI